MPSWVTNEIIILVITAVFGGIAWWFKARREDQLSARLADANQIKDQNKTIFDLQQERIKDAQDRSEGATRVARTLEQISQQLTELAKQNTEVLRRLEQKGGS